MTQISSLVSRSLSNFVEGLAVAIPRLLSGVIFLALAYATVRIVLALVRSSIERLYVGDRELVGDLIVTLVAVFLWFGVALTFLKVLGMGTSPRASAPPSASSPSGSRTRSPR